jgi:hypothetical protein
MAFKHMRFPFTQYHPVLGKRTAENADDMAKVFVGPEHNWFDTAEEADRARTLTDANMVMHNSDRMRVDHLAASGDPRNELGMTNAPPAEAFDIGTVVNSATHQERVVEPILNAPSEEDRAAEAEQAAAAVQEQHDAADDKDGGHTEVAVG